MFTKAITPLKALWGMSGLNFNRWLIPVCIIALSLDLINDFLLFSVLILKMNLILTDLQMHNGGIYCIFVAMLNVLDIVFLSGEKLKDMLSNAIDLAS